jgi:type I site-specific restriction-modification system R (restriction) subunit
MPPASISYPVPSDSQSPAVLREDARDPGNSFIWRNTGSGKTLTSFNASTLATLLPKLLNGELAVQQH